MTVDSPGLLVLAPVLGAAVGAVALLARRRRISRAAAWSDDLAQRARATGRWAPLLLGLAGLVAGVGLAGPRGGPSSVKTETQSLSVVLAVDISRSMLAEDTHPSRLKRAIQEAHRLVQDLGQDRIGLIGFAGRSYILSPLTLDGGAITLFLDGMSPEMASQGGTGLASALNQGRQLLNASREAGDRVLVLFTDGEAHDSLPDVLAAARQLKEQQIRLVLVAEGETKPVTIPLRDSTGAITEYKTDDAGKTVLTWRRDDILQQVADGAEGALVPADLPDQAGAVRELLSAFKRAPLSASTNQDLLPLVWIPALLAAILLAAQTVTRRTAALVGLGGLLLVSRLDAQRPAPGEREFASGNLAGAVRRLAARLAPTASDTVWYNAGTAFLADSQYEAASKALDHAARSLDPDLRFRALYNDGVAALLSAARDSARRDSLLALAADHLKQALTLAPTNASAKWNLELAERRHPPPPSGGGGSSPKQPPPGGQRPPDPSQGKNTPGTAMPNLSPSQADQILNSVAREELETRNRRLGKSYSTPPGEKDW
ncbi:MAG TPA: VWA domain-containing protein [Gemmatimonadales bacterium]|nr:VWA domain-containing protein [Gemmatimonadales bacterium]